jgi:hypothetical protein
MSWKRWLMVLFLVAFAGNVTGSSIIPVTAACFPCKGYCKTHPSAPQCN